MGKFAALFLLLAGLNAGPLFAQADPVDVPVPNQVYRSLESGKASHDAGTIHGVIDSIDYSSGTLVVKTKSGDRQIIAVVPSTAIYRGSEYATLGDLRRGQTVDVSVYEVGGRLVAQMIRSK